MLAPVSHWATSPRVTPRSWARAVCVSPYLRRRSRTAVHGLSSAGGFSLIACSLQYTRTRAQSSFPPILPHFLLFPPIERPPTSPARLAQRFLCPQPQTRCDPRSLIQNLGQHHSKLVL